MLTPGLAPGFFFVTPKLSGCNVFVAYDSGLHQHWIIRVSAKDNQKSNHGFQQGPKVNSNYAQHAQWILNKIEKTFNGTFTG